MHLKNNWKATIRACYFGYITQAIVNSLITLLFVTFQEQYGFSLARITFLITFNFGLQLCVDLLSALVVDRIGYRVSMVMAHVCAAAGLFMLGILPNTLSDPYAGILISVIVYALGGGLLEVLVSPVVEACPTDDKTAAMSLLHSFYCWGVVGVIVLSTVFFSLFGISRWPILAMLWAILPAVNAWVFTRVPIARPVEAEKSMSMRELAHDRIFWILIALMIFSGASEQAMSQWASAFAERALGVTKTAGDLFGPCMFSVFMGFSRTIHAKNSRIPLRRYLTWSGLLCIAGYVLAAFAPVSAFGLLGCAITGFAVGAMWPGSFSLASQNCPTGGTVMFAMLALGGDVGCAAGPTLTGLISDAFGGSLKAGLAAAIIFPLGLIASLALLGRGKRSPA